MNKSRKITQLTNIAIIFLLVASFNSFALGTIYYIFDDHIEEFRYSDNDEYSCINEGLKIINKLPIQFSITNQYFSGFDNLENSVRESILVGYMLKNNIATYSCGNGDICIDKNSINSNSIKKIFNTDTKVNSNNIKLYVDDYGNHSINSTSNSNYYRLVLDNNNHNYRKYTKFYKYKEDNDLYIIYVYEGYYSGNCTKDEKLELFDFMNGEKVFTGVCDGFNGFVDEPEDFDNLQLYKYEFKRNEEGKLYLYGFNPVNKR